MVECSLTELGDALNAERAAEEQRGLIRWLRPDFQNSATDKLTQKTIALPEPDLYCSVPP